MHILAVHFIRNTKTALFLFIEIQLELCGGFHMGATGTDEFSPSCYCFVPKNILKIYFKQAIKQKQFRSTQLVWISYKMLFISWLNDKAIIPQ